MKEKAKHVNILRKKEHRLLFKQLGLEIEAWTKSLLPCHVARYDKRYAQYLEMIYLMRMPEIENILFGKLEEIKIIGKDMIKEFYSSKKRKR